MASQVPLIGPNFLIASIEYTLQDGVNRQAGPNNGLIKSL